MEMGEQSPGVQKHDVRAHKTSLIYVDKDRRFVYTAVVYGELA